MPEYYEKYWNLTRLIKVATIVVFAFLVYHISSFGLPSFVQLAETVANIPKPYWFVAVFVFWGCTEILYYKQRWFRELLAVYSSYPFRTKELTEYYRDINEKILKEHPKESLMFSLAGLAVLLLMTYDMLYGGVYFGYKVPFMGEYWSYLIFLTAYVVVCLWRLRHHANAYGKFNQK